jgi:pilus assembly protein CpaF
LTNSSQIAGQHLQSADVEKLRAYLTSTLVQELEADPPPINHRRQAITKRLGDVYDRTQLRLADTLRIQIFRDVLDELLGYGPIQPLLEDPEISEVMVNGPKQVYIERKGKLVRTSVAFENDEHVLRVIERIILPLGRRVDAETPTVDARLPDGSRVNAVIPPVAIDGPSITIRKFAQDRLGIEQLIKNDSITESMVEFFTRLRRGSLEYHHLRGHRFRQDDIVEYPLFPDSGGRANSHD